MEENGVLVRLQVNSSSSFDLIQDSFYYWRRYRAKMLRASAKVWFLNYKETKKAKSDCLTEASLAIKISGLVTLLTTLSREGQPLISVEHWTLSPFSCKNKHIIYIKAWSSTLTSNVMIDV